MKVRRTRFLIITFITIFCVSIYLPKGTFVEGLGQNDQLADLRFSASFIQKWYCKDFTLERWIEELQMLQSRGVNEIILQNITNTKKREAYYKTNIYGYESKEKDIIHLALEAAEIVGLKVRIGLGENSDWWTRGVVDEKWLLEEAENNKLIFNEINTRYGGHQALGGWYIPYEFSGHFVMTKKQRSNLNMFYKEIANEIKKKSDLDIMISPYYNSSVSGRHSLQNWSKSLEDVFNGVNIDIVALQDSVGVQYNDIHNVKEIFYYTKQATDSLNVKLYANIETFTKSGDGFVPVDNVQIGKQMNSVRPYIDGYVAFSINHYQNK